MEILSYKVVTDGCEIRVCCGNGVNYLFFSLSLFCTVSYVYVHYSLRVLFSYLSLILNGTDYIPCFTLKVVGMCH